MTRLPDWEARLSAYLEPLMHKPFGPYGAHDCCTFAAGGVEAITGTDPIPEFRGKYSTAVGAARALKRYGAGTLEATMDTKFARVEPAFARRGDLAMHGGMVGICVGRDAVFVGEDDGAPGLVRFGRADWSACWTVG